MDLRIIGNVVDLDGIIDNANGALKYIGDHSNVDMNRWLGEPKMSFFYN